MTRPQSAPGGDHAAVDLDVVDDPDATSEERALDARLAHLLTDRVLALQPPPSRIDLAAAKARVDAARRRARRRRAWAVAGAGAAAVTAAVIVVATGIVAPPELGVYRPASSGRGEGDPAQLRAGVPDLPSDESARLEALQPPQPPPALRGGRVPLPFREFTTAVDCDTTAFGLGVQPAELDGLDTSRMTQACAVSDQAGSALGTDGELSHDRYLYRFYLPPGIDLGDAAPEDATARGISWTEVAVDQPAQPVVARDAPRDPDGGVTTIRWGAWDPALASVRRTDGSSSEITWAEPKKISQEGDAPTLAVRASVAAAPVTAVRAALGFVNQAGMRVVRSSDGSLLLVPSSPPVVSMQALGGGRLTRTPEGCLGLDDAGGFRLVRWPYGTTWDPVAQSLTVPGAGVVRLGQDVQLGGGEGGSLAPLGLLPAGCVSEKTWFAASPL
ncbi:hypothetical protein ACUN7V_02975 [Quadrisphaera oryzae]|uniref:hypothetical protein n=1 Tax=Quadrisphaera TaxID=317661 RepID=UPI001644FCAC|nr:hypothetical protein [Quadrisphaera sp. RL12-1S]MBC3760970.1 hypothetical protein [Quadrisphaera sp. RL12-1S]